ncbi:MAG: septum formation initiator family protein [Gemmatimonadota bacterium]
MSRPSEPRPPRRWGRYLLPAVFGIALYFVVFGGEYTIFDVRRARAEIEETEAELARLRHVNDSLRAWADSLNNDPAVLERIARERFGFIRDGEVLYQVAPDSGGPPDEDREPRTDSES